MAAEQLHLIERDAQAIEGSGLVGNLHQIRELTFKIQTLLHHRYPDPSGELKYPYSHYPNGYDYLAYTRQLDPQDKADLLAPGSGIAPQEFHKLMFNEGWRKFYLMNLLQTKEIEDNPSPEVIFNKLTSEKINMVAIPETHLLSPADDREQLIVLFGLHFLDASSQVSMDEMEGTADVLRTEKWIPLDNQRIEDMQLYSREPKPMNILAQTKLINRLFPNGKRFGFTPQAREISDIASIPEVIIPDYLSDHHSQHRVPDSAYEMVWGLGEQFINADWRVA